MTRLSRRRLESFFAALDTAALAGSQRGVERECLRVDDAGRLARSAHPAALGSALTHGAITTDFSEALVEFVTPPCGSPWEVIHTLCELHQFSHPHIGDEAFWPLSMPCGVDRDQDIPLARYGSSNVGRMKTVYRRGLGYRYGRTMQTISGVHFNFSPGDAWWRAWQAELGNSQAFAAFKSAAYFVLVRNFRRFAWLVLYLFGASPAVCKSFLAGREHGLDEFDADTLYKPYATSLRMSNLGYSNVAQAGLNISVNSLDEYVAGLSRAISTPYAPYAKIGVEVDGEWRQLSANILQIANEFYSVVRPKRITHSGEEPTHALRDRGVEYVEVRALDISPAHPVGVGRLELKFLECFLYHCAVAGAGIISSQEQVSIDHNQLLVASRGRDPDLQLRTPGGEAPLRDLALDLCEQLQPIAACLDRTGTGTGYAAAVTHFAASVRDPSLTPSAQVLTEMREQGLSHVRYGNLLARRHKDYFRDLAPLSPATLDRFDERARESLREQADIEASDSGDFRTYLARYFEQV